MSTFPTASPPMPPPPTPPAPTKSNRRTHMWVILMLVAALILVVVNSFSNDDPKTDDAVVASTPEPSTPTPTPEPDSPAAHGTYGSDSTLDRLQDRCAAGSRDACDSLYWDSPLDSEYEEFALDSGNLSPLDSSVSDDIYRLAMEQTWNESSASQQDSICMGMILTPEEMIDIAMESDISLPRSEVRAFFDDKCGL